MPYRNIRVEHQEHLTWVVLDRPDKANALSAELLEELTDALASLVDDGGPVIAIRGEGRGFSAGYDIGKVGLVAPPDPVANRDRLQSHIARYLALWDHPKPIIAAVHGYCLGGASQLCVFADVTVVAHDARVGEPVVPIGGGFVAPLWAPLVGAKRAKELAFVPGNSIDGPTAVEWGWANHSVPAEDLVPLVEDLAGRFARTPPDVLRIKKLSINRAMEAMGVRHATAHVAEMDALLHASAEVTEVRARIAEIGLAAALREYAIPRTSPLTRSDERPG